MNTKIKKVLIAAALGIGIIATAAFAFDPSTNPDEWQKMLQKSLHLNTFKGEPWVMAINATPDELTVDCEKWSVVGPEPYKTLKKNPASLAPWSITPIHATPDFDGYCKDGLKGIGGFNSYTGKLNGGEGHFSSSTILVFVAPTK